MKTILLIMRWIGAFLGWCLFFFWWRKASTPGWVSPRAVGFSLFSIVAVLSCAIAYSIIWILHNKRIARQGKRGYVSFYKSPHFESDALGRKLTLPVREDIYDSVIVLLQNKDSKEYIAERNGPVKAI